VTYQQILNTLKAGASAKGASGTQRFFREPVASLGWRTPDLDRFARELSVKLPYKQRLEITKKLAAGKTNEEFHLAVFLLERPKVDIARNFKRFEQMLRHVDNWAKCDSLSMRLIGPALVERPELAPRMIAWAGSKNPWKCRAAAASLVLAARGKLYLPIIKAVSKKLISRPEDLVQKGIGWLLREWGKADPRGAASFLQEIKPRATRLVLRTACEKLPAASRAQILGAAPNRKASN
jgi:3-methyladenine DNA glycosylase AlkD